MAKGPKKTGNKILDAGIAHGWDHFFDSMVADIEAGNLPPKNAIIRGLRSGNPIPKAIRDFIADILEGKISYPPSRPPAEFPELKNAIYKLAFDTEMRVIERWERIRKEQWPDKNNTALERAGERCHVSARTIERALSF